MSGLVTIDIYSNLAQTQTTYPIPGPPLYPNGVASSPAPAVSIVCKYL